MDEREAERERDRQEMMVHHVCVHVVLESPTIHVHCLYSVFYMFV